jgi:hypothetical protein
VDTLNSVPNVLDMLLCSFLSPEKPRPKPRLRSRVTVLDCVSSAKKAGGKTEPPA